MSEQYEVRETVKQNLYTGKTYNSVENINQFFAERGVQVPLRTASAAGCCRQSGAQQPASGSAASRRLPPAAPQYRRAPPVQRKKGIRSGSTFAIRNMGAARCCAAKAMATTPN